MATATTEIDEIRRSMAQIRRDLHADVQGVVEGAEAATDWKRYVRSYPFATLGLALAVGFLVVPRRHKPTTVVALTGNGADPMPYVKANAPLPVAPEKKGKSLLGLAFGLVGPVVLRAGQGYALQFFEQWLSQQMSQQLQMHPELAGAFAKKSDPRPGPGVQPPGTPRF